jgi:predicted HTH transcriptional regulator
VSEAIVNAIAHRDYHSNASVEVRLFSDRLEIWNPGMLPGNLTLESLRNDHPSAPYNPLIAEPLYLARYIERIGSGTQTMIALCYESGLPEPQFELRTGSFVTTIWRDWLTPEVLARYNLNERQVASLNMLKSEQRITTMLYQNLVGCSRRTAARDLDELLDKGIILRLGAGRNAYYVIAMNRAVTLPIVPAADNGELDR